MIAAALRCYVALAIAGVLAGCATAPAPKQIVRTETIEVPHYIREPLPAEFVQPRDVVPQPANCTLNGRPVLCNGELRKERDDYRDALRLSNADKACLRALDAGDVAGTQACRSASNTPPSTPAPAPAAGGHP